jgi:hypothetical protein
MARSNPTGRRIAIFAYAWNWNTARRLDPYIGSIVDNFSRIGFEVDVFIGNEFSADRIYGLSSKINFDALLNFIGSAGYSFVLSFNNALLSEIVLSALDCPIVTWVVDDLKHMFDPDRCGWQLLFEKNVKVIVSSTAIQREIVSLCPAIGARLKFLPTATATGGGEVSKTNSNKKYQISMVASFLDATKITDLYYRYIIENSDLLCVLDRCCKNVRAGKKFDWLIESSERWSIDRILLDCGLDRVWFEIQLQNFISNQERAQAVERTSKLGVTLFGNPDWILAFGSCGGISTSFRPSHSISCHRDLMDIYNSSRICINVPQIQVCGALPYRVLDILASDALLITKYSEADDATTLFGLDCPIVTFKDLDELYFLCDFYLKNDDRRLDKVNQCKELVRSGFDFADRCRDILDFLGVPLCDGSFTGSIQYLDLRSFRLRRGKRFEFFGINVNISYDGRT